MWAVTFALFTALFSLLSLSNASQTTNCYIIEINPEESQDDALSEIHDFFAAAPRPPPTISTTFSYTSPLFHGVSLAIDISHTPWTPDTLTTHLRALPRVQNLFPVHRRTLPRPVPQPQAQDPSAPGARPPSAANTHAHTGVAALHALGFRGANATIAVIDTGADYTNPFLSGGIGAGYRVAYGYDLIGDSMRPPGAPTPDADPFSECQPHGTHVAGIIAGRADELGWVGVAPEAVLEVYRVFDCEGVTETDVIVDAVLRAAARGVDVVNLSLGGGGPFEEDAVSAVLSRLNNNGSTYCVASMGNEGTNGTFTSQAPSSGLAVPAIGAMAPFEVQFAGWNANYTVGDNTTQNTFFWMHSEKSIYPPVLDLYVVSFNTSIEDDACSPLPPSTPDLSNRLVLIRRGGCTFAKKFENVLKKGGRYVVIYNNKPGNEPLGLVGAGNGTIGAAGIGQKDGLDLIRAFAMTHKVQVTMNTTDYPNAVHLVPNTENGGRMATFSSMGPPALGYLKPTLSAPGTQILSTVPRSDGYFDNFSGTSQAAPYISGVVALLKQARPNLSYKQIIILLATTAKPTQFSDGSNFSYPFPAPAWQQGGGMVAAYDAYRCQTLLDVEALAFNDTAHFARELSFTVRNIGNEPQSYQLSNIPAATVLSYRGNGDPNPIKFFPNESWPLPNEEFTQSLTPDFASIAVTPNSFALAPGASQTVTVSADISQLAHLRPQCPLFSGWIAINGTIDTLTLPWGAIGCALYDLPVIDPKELLIHLVAADNETEYNASLKSTHPLPRIEPNRVFVLPKDNSTDARINVTYPWLQYKFSQYVRFAKIDLLGANGSKVATLLDANTTTDVERLPVSYQNFTGMLPWGEWADEGQYRFNLSALRLYGNPNGTEDWKDWVVSDPFIVKYR